VPAPLLIAGKDLRQRVRDRSAIVVAVVAPLVIAALMSFAFKGADTFHYTLGLVDADHGPVATGLDRILHEAPVNQVLAVKEISTRQVAASQVRSNKVQAALIIPKGFSAALEGARPLPLSTLTSVNNQAAGNITASIASSFVAQLNANRLSLATALGAGATGGQVAGFQSALAALRIPEQVVQRSVGSQPLKVISYYGPAMAIFFLFFTISYTARSFFVDRSTGMIERMRAAPIRPVEILLGKVLSAFVFGLLSLSIVALVTTLAFGANWGSPLAAGAVCLAMVIAVVCLTALVIALARTQRQAEGIASAVVFGLALLGGNFVFLSAVPDVMKRIALFTPNGQALRALTDLSTTGGGLSVVVTPVLAILGFGLVVGLVAALLSRRAVAS
jgi:ABC-2 type transport system permease protein